MPAQPTVAILSAEHKLLARRYRHAQPVDTATLARPYPMPLPHVGAAARSVGRFLWQTIEEFVRDGCPQMAGALSFYTLFSLPPLLVLIIMMIEPFLDPQAAIDAFRAEITAFLGPGGAGQVQTLLEHVRRPGEGDPFAAAAGIVAFLFGATAAFGQLQFALNTAWQVGPDPERGEIKNFLLKRFLSFAMILGIGFLLLTSLVLSALIAAFGGFVEVLTPDALTRPVLSVINHLVSFSVITVLFAAMFKLLPDAVVAWKHAFVGGAVTALLFTLGKAGIGIYLGQSDPGSVYGAAGSLAVVLIWIYYSSMILFWGAEFTKVWAEWRGAPIRPVPGAVHIVQRQERVEKVPKARH
jgi:membrane protein